MKTQHEIVFSNAKSMEKISSNSIHLIITSPPYPMIEMWDSLFSSLNSEIQSSLESGNGKLAFELMHQELDYIWQECSRVLVPGGIFCVNIGDATRKIGNEFHMYPNHGRIIQSLYNLDFFELPSIIWRKQTNSPNKFMGSGMLPSNAYVTLEHEYILIFRKGKEKRKFPPKSVFRYQSAYFWEERNKWFSDIWTDLKGINQEIEKNENFNGKLRERSAAFPFELPYRLINMFSIYEDIILDPFLGTGTTTLAAMVAGRNSIGYEINSNFLPIFSNQLSKLKEFSRRIVSKRIETHQNFMNSYQKKKKQIKYSSNFYNLPVITKQEENIKFKKIISFEGNHNKFEVKHNDYINEN